MYIVIECHGGPDYCVICTDKNGENMLFEIEAEAMLYAEDCQDPIIVEVG